MSNEAIAPEAEDVEIDEAVVAGVVGELDIEGAETTSVKESSTLEPEEVHNEEPIVKSEAVEEKSDDTPDVETSLEKEEVSIEDIAGTMNPDAKEEDDTFEGVSSKSQKKIEKKLGRYVKERNVARDEAATLKEENARLKQEQVPNERPTIPDRDEFDTKEEWQAEMTKWKDADDEFKAAKTVRDARDEETKARYAEATDRYNESVDRVKSRYDDYDTVIADAPKMDRLALTLSLSGVGGEISYYLAKNPDRFKAIDKLDDISAVLAVGEIAGQFKSLSKKTTKAPKPLNVVKGSEGGPKDMLSIAAFDKVAKGILDVV